MSSLLSSKKSVLVLLVLGLASIYNINSVNAIPQAPGAPSTFKDIDTSREVDAKGAAEKVCGANLSAEELFRREGLASAAVSNFWNPAILGALAQNNEPLNIALNCQKQRIKVLSRVCSLAANTKAGKKCETDEAAGLLTNDFSFIAKKCPIADTKLFTTAVGVNEPNPPVPRKEACGAPGAPSSPERSTTNWSVLDISKTPGAPRENAERNCQTTLSVFELKHRSRMSEIAINRFLEPKITAAAGNAPLLKALNCQKARIGVQVNVCLINRARVRKEVGFSLEENLTYQQRNVAAADSFCAGADQNLFTTFEPFCFRDNLFNPC